jgi:hypothetical protein
VSVRGKGAAGLRQVGTRKTFQNAPDWLVWGGACAVEAS